MQGLDEDSLVEIRLRLPIRTLQRFRCVSKAWDASFMDPLFQYLYEQRSRSPSFRLPFKDTVDPSRTHLKSLSLLQDGGESIAEPTLRTLSEKYINVLMLPSFRDLICLVIGSVIWIWNPSTGFMKKLPCDLPSGRRDRNHYYGNEIGFGYLKCADEYKVLRRRRRACEVLTLHRNSVTWYYVCSSWKKVKFSPRYDIKGSCVHADKFLYWLTANHRLFCFDLESEESRELELPGLPDDLSCDVGFVGGRDLWMSTLGLHSNVDRAIDMWVLRYYNMNQTYEWVKQYTIEVQRPCFTPRVLCVRENRALLSYYGGWNVNEYKFSSCDMETGVMTFYRTLNTPGACSVCDYTEGFSTVE